MTSTHKIPDRLLSFALLSGDIHFVIPTHAYRYNQHLYCSCINTIDDSRGPCANPPASRKSPCKRLPDFIGFSILDAVRNHLQCGIRLHTSSGCSICLRFWVINNAPSHYSSTENCSSIASWLIAFSWLKFSRRSRATASSRRSSSSSSSAA